MASDTPNQTQPERPMPYETTFHLDVRATIDGTPVDYRRLPVAAKTEADARAYLEAVLREQRYTDVQVTPAPIARAD